jgi:hypothetical protein
METKILAVGCSMTNGHGLDQGCHDPRLWVNQIFHDIGTVHNLAVTGMNNHWIFLETMSTLVQRSHAYDIVLVGWSAIPRFCFHAGLELYSVHTRLTNDHDINVNNGLTFKKEWLKKLGDDLRKLHNDHWDILDLIKYVNGLITIHETSPNKKIFFVNTLSPWGQNYFEFKKISLPSDLDPYTQDLLQVQTRDDNEISKLYTMIHTQYARHGGIRESHWLNLYDSLRAMQVDNVSALDPHPGYKSQEKYAKYLGPILRRKLGIV